MKPDTQERHKTETRQTIVENKETEHNAKTPKECTHIVLVRVVAQRLHEEREEPSLPRLDVLAALDQPSAEQTLDRQEAAPLQLLVDAVGLHCSADVCDNAALEDLLLGGRCANISIKHYMEDKDNP